MQLLIYTKQTTSRIEYIFSTLLTAAGVEHFQITNDTSIFFAYDGPKINYSLTLLDEREVHISPVPLLFETGIKPQATAVFYWNELSVFFKCAGEDLPFDIFAASFYLLTRYEEYLPHSPDMYGRYAHENSIAYKNNFLQLPLVNLWLKEFVNILLQHYPTISLKLSVFRLLPTYDIDIAWSYLHKGFLRNAGGFIRSIVKGDWSMMKERMNVLIKKKKDPFDSYDWLHALHRATSLQPLYFFLIAQQNKGYDKNILQSNIQYQQLIKQHANRYAIGIHPSWQSGDDDGLLKSEVEQLEKINNKPINKSRQHYIRMKLPDTYRELLEAGITEDYSMGYGSINGFRASYCLSYQWYDLEKETTTPLTIYPFCHMDANSFYEQKYSSAEALKELEYYHLVTKKVNGLMIIIWHNHFLGTDKMFAGWREVYEQFIMEHVSV